MLGPFDLPLRLTRDLADAVQRLSRVDELLERRFDRIERGLAELNETTESLKPLLVQNRDAIEAQAPRFERMLRELEGTRAALAALSGEFREIAEPLRGPAERAARISGRLPGRG